MGIISDVISFILHIDTHLGEIIVQYGPLSYAILFIIIFIETGLVFTPFLPGDSLLFAAGAFAALGSFNVVLLFFLLWFAAFLGDTVNYWIGHFFGQRIVSNPKLPIKKEHVDKTQAFYDKHGGKTIFLARFIPIVRTFAPFVAGIGRMSYRHFIMYNVLGGLVWVACFLFAGYFFGNIPKVKENFSLVVFVIIFLSILPIILEFLKNKLRSGSRKI